MWAIFTKTPSNSKDNSEKISYPISIKSKLNLFLCIPS